MRDGVGFEKENAVANDTKSATTWHAVRDSPAFCFLRAEAENKIIVFASVCTGSCRPHRGLRT